MALLRPKTFRRLLVLFLILAGTGSGAFLLHVRGQQGKAQSLRLDRNKGLEAFAAGDYQAALILLEPWTVAHPSDTEAALAHAVSRGHVPTPAGNHLSRSAELLAKLVERAPNQLQARHALLEVLTRQADPDAILALTADTLDHFPQDAVTLRYQRYALTQLSDYEAALKVSQQLNVIDRASLDDQIQTLRLMALAGQPPEALLDYARERLGARGDAPAQRVLLAMAYDHIGNSDAAARELEQAATSADADTPVPVVMRIVELHDRLRDFGRGTALLQRLLEVADEETIASLRRELALRHWRAHRYSEAYASLRPRGDRDVPTDLLAVEALVLASDARREEAMRNVQELARRAEAGPDRRIAVAWDEALRAQLTEPPLVPRERVERLRRAHVREPASPEIQAWLGEALAELGEGGVAMLHWRRAAAGAPDWAEPHEQMAAYLLSQGRLADAEAAIEQALQRPGADGDTAALQVQIAFARWRAAPSPAAAAAVATLARAHQATSPGDARTLPIYVRMTAVEDPDTAKSLLLAIVQANTEPDLLAELADVSRVAQLGVENVLLAHAPETPQVAAVRAQIKAESGDPAGAVRDLRAAATRGATSENARQWLIVLARFLEANDPTSAAAAWRQLGERFPDDLEVQGLILEQAQSVRGDRAFLDKTIDRLRALTGESGRRWRLERARWLLDGDNPAQLNEALAMLSGLLRSTTETREARLLLSRGLEQVGNDISAAAHLRIVVDAEPSDTEAGLRLVSILERLGRFEEARDYLRRMAAEGAAAEPADATAQSSRVVLAEKLDGYGDAETALTLLTSADEADVLGDAGHVLLAKLLINADERSAARQHLAAVLEAGSTDEAAAEAALQLALLDRNPDSHFDRFTPLVKDWLTARFHASRGNVASARQAAAAAFRRALDPGNDLLDTRVAAWVLRFKLADQASEDLQAEIDAAIDRWPLDDELQQLATDVAQIAEAFEQPLPRRMSLMLRAINRDELRRQWSQAVEHWMTSGADSLNAEDVTSLDAMHLRYPTDVDLGRVTLEGYLALGQGSDALRVARRLVKARPLDATSAVLAMRAARRVPDWRRMERFAARWRHLGTQQRAHFDPIWADTAIAEARLRRDDEAGALQALAPHRERAKQLRSEFGHLLALAAEAHAANGDYDEALAIIEPSLSQLPEWRTVALRLAGEVVPEAREARRWIDLTTAASGDTSPQEALRVAQAWERLGTRFDDADATRRSVELYHRLTDGPLRDDAETWFGLARTSSLLQDRPTAAGAYARLATLRPQLPTAFNELAMLLVLHPEQATAGLDETAREHGSLALTELDPEDPITSAVRLAQVATKLAPQTAAFHDTLARAQRAAKEFDAAAASFERALRLDPQLMDAALGLSDLLVERGQVERAQRLFDRVRSRRGEAGARNLPFHLAAEYRRLAEQFPNAVPAAS